METFQQLPAEDEGEACLEKNAPQGHPLITQVMIPEHRYLVFYKIILRFRCIHCVWSEFAHFDQVSNETVESIKSTISSPNSQFID